MRIILRFSLFLILVGVMSFKAKAPEKPQKFHVHNKTTNLDFDLVNRTGYDISDVFVAPSNQDEWGDGLLETEILENGDTIEISFDGNETIRKWDIYVTWDGYDSSEDVYWTGFDLSVISEITLFYDAKTGKSWAKYK
jgi:hypothetical protein